MLIPGNKIQPGEILFTKIEDEQVETQLDKLKERSVSKAVHSEHHVPLKTTTDFKNFSSLDLRVGEIVAAEEVEGSDKLLKLQIDIGFEKRTILSGIREQYSPDDIIGQKVSIIANLKPKKMMGIESNGMVLMAEDGEGKLLFVSTDAANGSQIL
jgi:methionyl-tRNA synthetase